MLPPMSRLPDSVLLRVNTVTSVLLIVALGLVGLALVGGPRVSWIVLMALVIPVLIMSSEVTRRAGGKAGVPAWQQSRAWSADTFDLHARDNARGRARVEAAVRAAVKAGYTTAGEPAIESGRFGPLVRQRMIRVLP
jgi:hypothetical protein